MWKFDSKFTQETLNYGGKVHFKILEKELLDIFEEKTKDNKFLYSNEKLSSADLFAYGFYMASFYTKSPFLKHMLRVKDHL